VDDVNLSPTIEYYRSKLAEHGPGARGMDWKDQNSQQLRFEVIARHIDFSRAPSILDVGCGSGGFLEHCRECGHEIDYLGIDVCPEMVAVCRGLHGDQSARQATAGDLEAWDEQYDYVIASGTFNAKLDAEEAEWQDYFHGSILAMFRVCRVAVIVNMMTSFVDYRYDRLYYATPQEIATLAVTKMSRRFVIDHNYPLYEMTAAIYRQSE
jgi:SAM-dependent methyltransferase